MDYTFSVNVNYPSYMQTQIGALGLLSANLLNIGTDSSTDPMTVDLTFDSVLSDADLPTLTNYMNSYIDPSVTPAALALVMTALNVDANVMIIARARIKQTIPLLDVITQLTVCSLLGINPNT